MLCLSIRPPWSLFIFAESPHWKNVENRNWPTDVRGNVLIHSAKGCTAAEYTEAIAFALKAGLGRIPRFESMRRGGIIGMARLTRCVVKHDSPWFQGRFGFVLEQPYPLPFFPCPGDRGFFEFRYDVMRLGPKPALTNSTFRI